MVVIELDKLLDINTISKRNSFRFKDIKKKLDEYPDEKEIILDCRYMDIEDKFNEDFKEIVLDKRVKIRAYNKELYSAVNTIACFGGYEQDEKVELILIEGKPFEDKVVTESNRMAEKTRNNIKLENGVYRVIVKEVASCIDRLSTLNGLFKAIEDLDKDKEILFDLSDVVVEDEQLKDFSSRIIKYNQSGYKVEAITNDATALREMSALVALGKVGRMKSAQKVKVLNEEFPVNTAGILTTYESKGSNDILGRSGGGKVSTVLPAIYIGNDGNKAKFKVFRLDTFKTAYDYESDNDNEMHPGLRSVIKVLEINELGIGAYCAGHRYHFNLPVQFNEDGFQFTWKESGDSVRRIRVSLPQYMKMVFDEFREDYDYKIMCDCLRMTKDSLKEKGIYFEM